jgi:hypothetical protein
MLGGRICEIRKAELAQAAQPLHRRCPEQRNFICIELDEVMDRVEDALGLWITIQAVYFGRKSKFSACGSIPESFATFCRAPIWQRSSAHMSL